MSSGAPGPELLARLLDRHGAALALYARQWCASPDDVVQEAFLRLAAQADCPRDPAAWLFRVVRNGAISAGRSETRRRKHEAQAAKIDRDRFEATDDLGIDLNTVSTALTELAGEDREVIVLHLWGGLTFGQIAELVESSASTVFRRYQAALVELRNKLLKLAK
jgi:RNA polymerase sigma factor (sigma-70 family)